MNNSSNKIVVIALSVVCFILLYSTIAFYVMEETEKGKKNGLQKKFNEITLVKEDLETKLKDIETMNVELKTRLKSQEDTISSMTERIEIQKKENMQNIFKLQARGNDIRGMRAKIENERIEKESLLKKIEKANEEAVNLKLQLDNLTKTGQEADKNAKDIAEKEGVSLGTIVIDQKAH